MAWSQWAMTGSYDYTMRVWNVDFVSTDTALSSERCLEVLVHGAPFEALLLVPGAALPRGRCHDDSEGGFPLADQLKVWNPITGQCVQTMSAQHRKSITSLSMFWKPHHPTHSTHPRHWFGRPRAHSLVFATHRDIGTFARHSVGRALDAFGL